nr:hypothetical protein Iba_chr02aCG20380 [Ipomoea batatas]
MQLRILLNLHHLVGNGVCDSMLGDRGLTWFSGAALNPSQTPHSGKATKLEISDSNHMGDSACRYVGFLRPVISGNCIMCNCLLLNIGDGVAWFEKLEWGFLFLVEFCIERKKEKDVC